MKKKYLILVITLLLSFSFYAQKTIVKPTSIYTFSNPVNTKNSYSSLNKKLKLKNFDFIYLNLNDLDMSLLTVPFKDLCKTPSDLIYDDYKSYRDDYLLKGFLLENDPSRWNLQCPSPLSVQPKD